MKLIFVITATMYQLKDASNGALYESWPKKKYSRQKALSRADRFVGQLLREGLHVKSYSVQSDTPVMI